MERVLLIGGGGFIGAALARRLICRAYEVHIVSPHKKSNLSKKVRIHQGRIEDKEVLEKILPKCKTVFHLASATTPASSVGHPLMEGEQNVMPTLRLLEVLQNYKNIHLVFLSSGGTLYGNPEKLPVNEKHPLQPRSYHGAGKVAAESFIWAYGSNAGKNVTVLRPSNLYGPGQLFRKDFGVIRAVLQHLKQGTTMEIWGDGESVRDFLYIDDMVDLCSRMIDFDTKDQIYNVGSGIGHSVNQIIKISESVSGKKLRINYKPVRHVDVKNIVLDISKIQNDTGWRPEVQLFEGIERTWKWILDQ